MSQQYPKLRRRHALQLLAGISGAAILNACNTGADSEGSVETGSDTGGSMSLTLGTAPWMGQLPVYIAQEKGFYEEAGLDFTLRNFNASGDYMAAFASGNVDGLAPVSSEAITLAASGEDLKIVLIQSNSVGGDGILAKNDIASVADFSGKKIAVDTSGVSYFFLLQVLEEAGLSADEVSIVNMDPGAAAAAFESGNVDVAVTYFPYLQQAAAQATDGKIIYDSSKMPTAITDLYLFSAQYIEENPDAVQAFVNATLKGYQYAQENTKEAIAIAAAAIEITPEEVEEALKGVEVASPEMNLKMVAQPDSDVYIGGRLEDLANFLLAEEQIDAKPEDIAALIDPQFIEAASF